MITEKDKVSQQKEKLENGIRLCEEAISKAEKYERLKDNKDWQGYLEDLKVLVTLHEREIKVGVSMLLEAPTTGHVKRDNFDKDVYVSSREDWTNFISHHEIQKEECENWIKEPDRVILLASMAREKLPMLKEKLSEINHVPEVETGKP